MPAGGARYRPARPVASVAARGAPASHRPTTGRARQAPTGAESNGSRRLRERRGVLPGGSLRGAVVVGCGGQMAVVCTACELPGVVHRDSAFATGQTACHPGANGRGDALRAGTGAGPARATARAALGRTRIVERAALPCSAGAIQDPGHTADNELDHLRDRLVGYCARPPSCAVPLSRATAASVPSPATEDCAMPQQSVPPHPGPPACHGRDAMVIAMRVR